MSTDEEMTRESSIAYVMKEYDFPLEDTEKMWDAAVVLHAVNKVKPNSSGAVLLGKESTVFDQFFTMAAMRMYDECTNYVCAHGCCNIWWHAKLGYQGGFGPAGCECEDLEDPRGGDPKLVEKIAARDRGIR